MANGANQNKGYNHFGLNIFIAPEEKSYRQPPLRFRHLSGSPSLEYRHTAGKCKYIFDWLYVLVMSCTRFRVNPHSIVAWMSRNFSLEKGAMSEV